MRVDQIPIMNSVLPWLVIFVLVLVGCGKQADDKSTYYVEPAMKSASEQRSIAVGEPRIFPGAEGFGTASPGGRGGQVCIVTNLDDAGVGSLRHCVEQSGPRVVVFNVGGIIKVRTPITISDPFISIYGQTATGDGILLRASLDTKTSPLVIDTHDVLIQHLRIRAGSSRLKTCCRDAVRIGNKTPDKVYNVVLDHNSLSWGTDQIASAWFDVQDITFSYNIFSESLHDNGSNDEGPAGRGLLIGSEGAHSISIHHNFFAHSYQRNPMLATSGVVDVVNNLIYHWVSRGGQQASTHDGQRVNWVKNKYIALDSPQMGKKQRTSVKWGDIFLSKEEYSMKQSVYFKDNLGNARTSSSQPEWAIAYTDYDTPYDPELGYHTLQRFSAPPIAEIPVDKLEKILPEYVGAILPKRDSVDARLMNQLKARNGKMPNCVQQDDRNGEERCNNNVGGWPAIAGGRPRVDSDNDGLPDNWEKANGTDPVVDDAMGDIDGDGYTNIENWISQLR